MAPLSLHSETGPADPGAIGMDEDVFVIDARPEAVASIRHAVTELARSMPFSERDVGDIETAVGEAASNAVTHGSPDARRCRITVRCERLQDRFVVHVSDEGHGFDPGAHSCEPPNSLVEGGRGLFFMRSLMDEVSFTFSRGTTVRLVKRLRPGGPEDSQKRTRRDVQQAQSGIGW